MKPSRLTHRVILGVGLTQDSNVGNQGRVHKVGGGEGEGHSEVADGGGQRREEDVHVQLNAGAGPVNVLATYLLT